MATPDIQRNSIDAGNLPPEPDSSAGPTQRIGGAAGRPLRNVHWLDRIFYISGAIAGIGFLVVLFAAYLVPSLVAILVGTILISLGVIAWIFTALLLIFIMLKSLLGRGGSSL